MKIARHRGMKKVIVMHVSGYYYRIWVDGTEFRSYPGEQHRHECHLEFNVIGEHLSSTQRWNDVPRGTDGS